MGRLLIGFHVKSDFFFVLASSVFRLTETIASTPGFQQNAGLVQEVQLYIKLLLKCLTKKIYTSPKVSVSQLKEVLKSISSGSDGDNEIEVNAR